MAERIQIKENWDLIEKAENLAREKTGDPDAGFNASTLFFGTSERQLMIPILYRSKKGKKGQEQFTSSYKELMVYADFCPFSGKPLYKIEDDIKINS